MNGMDRHDMEILRGLAGKLGEIAAQPKQESTRML
jgi:hypothetical protein